MILSKEHFGLIDDGSCGDEPDLRTWRDSLIAETVDMFTDQGLAEAAGLQD